MSSLTRLRKSKKNLEEKLEKKKKRKDALGKELLDFPNLTIPLNLFTFFPAFLILMALSRAINVYNSVNSMAMVLGIFGLLSWHPICRLEKQWFTYYGRNREIIREEIPWDKRRIAIWVLCSIAIVGAGLLVKNTAGFLMYIAAFGYGSVYLAMHKDALLWDMPPARLLGFKKYRFSPKNSDNHTVRNGTYRCVIRGLSRLNPNDNIEGTFLGNGWHNLRKEKP